jgi:peptide/nickel transport system permease protein
MSPLESVAAVEASPPARGRGRWARWKDALGALVRSKVALVGLTIVVFWVFVAVFAPLLTPPPC